jgi:hypothetical protein
MMAAEEKVQVDALETLVSITEKCGNLRKDLNNDIHVLVSTLRKAFSHLIHQLDNVKNTTDIEKRLITPQRAT